MKVRGYRVLEMKRGGNGSGGNERNVNGGGLAVPQTNGGTTEERSENLTFEMRRGR